MQYILMLHVDEAGWPKLTKAEQEQGMAAYIAYTEALKNAGALVGTNRLQPSSTATTTYPISMLLYRGRHLAPPQVTVWSRCARS